MVDRQRKHGDFALRAWACAERRTRENMFDDLSGSANNMGTPVNDRRDVTMTTISAHNYCRLAYAQAVAWQSDQEVTNNIFHWRLT